MHILSLKCRYWELAVFSNITSWRFAIYSDVSPTGVDKQSPEAEADDGTKAGHKMEKKDKDAEGKSDKKDKDVDVKKDKKIKSSSPVGTGTRKKSQILTGATTETPNLRSK